MILNEAEMNETMRAVTEEFTKRKLSALEIELVLATLLKELRRAQLSAGSRKMFDSLLGETMKRFGGGNG